ncbi:transglycosylase SLT domain protein [Rhodococcus sp. MTM3W5.2]|nr:transglycosylase SLT domain protein [Rhodococcus sp. MTM3W5.2]
MGRHSKKNDSNLRRNSVVALAGLVPAGLVVGTTASASPRSRSRSPPSPHRSPTFPPPRSPRPSPPPWRRPPRMSPRSSRPPRARTRARARPLPDGPLGIPGINFAAYQSAEKLLAKDLPGCGITWMQIAGIGMVESHHANGGQAHDNGDVFEPVIGLPLNGSLPGQAVIMDTDGGALDGDTVYDRAVGPTQFIPTTWAQFGADGNGDGKIDPQNLFDSAAATGKYLCDRGTNMRDIGSATMAIHRYNNSMAYVANVTAWALAYSTGITPTADALPRIH